VLQNRTVTLDLDQIAAEPYEARGILNSEMALILTTILDHGIGRVIESGRARGQSTYMLAKYLPDVDIHSIELRDGHPDESYAKARLSGFKNVTLYYGSGIQLVPHLVPKHERTAILLDGPKGAAAVAILEVCFERPNVVIGFIHDMRRLDHGAPSPHRANAIERLPRHKFSDDPALVSASSWIDAGIVSSPMPCGPEFEAVHGSYGPTVGLFLNHVHPISNQQ
jgi:hypothetical protein